ncbi:DNA-binding protein [Micromonospora sp. NPDC049801]|uniref:helix-turn-helix transcriptional regulator n=1 Tax=unclassified Micromonospora TaxID=2617518 RepID=UPI0033F8E863
MGRHLMGAREIEDRLGVSRQRVHQLMAQPNWPKPYDVLAMGKVWRIEDVEEWIRENRPALHDAEAGPTVTPVKRGGRRKPATD